MQKKETVVYEDLQKFPKKRPQAPLPSSEKVVYADILHFPPKTEQHPPSESMEIEESEVSIKVIIISRIVYNFILLCRKKKRSFMKNLNFLNSHLKLLLHLVIKWYMLI